MLFVISNSKYSKNHRIMGAQKLWHLSRKYNWKLYLYFHWPFYFETLFYIHKYRYVIYVNLQWVKYNSPIYQARICFTCNYDKPIHYNSSSSTLKSISFYRILQNFYRNSFRLLIYFPFLQVLQLPLKMFFLRNKHVI